MGGTKIAKIEGATPGSLHQLKDSLHLGLSLVGGTNSEYPLPGCVKRQPAAIWLNQPSKLACRVIRAISLQRKVGGTLWLSWVVVFGCRIVWMAPFGLWLQSHVVGTVWAFGCWKVTNQQHVWHCLLFSCLGCFELSGSAIRSARHCPGGFLRPEKKFKLPSWNPSK